MSTNRIEFVSNWSEAKNVSENYQPKEIERPTDSHHAHSLMDHSTAIQFDDNHRDRYNNVIQYTMTVKKRRMNWTNYSEKKREENKSFSINMDKLEQEV